MAAARQFLERFYPWQMLKLLTEPRHLQTPLYMPQRDHDQDVAQVTELLETVHRHEQNLTQQHHDLGFSLHKRASTIAGAGWGVFLKGHCKRGHIVSFYPGTIYLPSEPLFLVSLSNHYILKCFDGKFVDGKSTGLSKRVHTSLYHRENWPGAIQTGDMTWLTDRPRNPFAVGQIVNNGTRGVNPNVHYHEIDLPPTFPMHLRQFIPNIYWSSVDTHQIQTRLVVLVALRDICDEELFSKYMDTVP